MDPGKDNLVSSKQKSRSFPPSHLVSLMLCLHLMRSPGNKATVTANRFEICSGEEER